MKVLDARGLSCPEPVIMIRQAMAKKEDRYEMTVDNVTSRENVTRFAEHQGYTVEVTENDGEYTLLISRNKQYDLYSNILFPFWGYSI